MPCHLKSCFIQGVVDCSMLLIFGILDELPNAKLDQDGCLSLEVRSTSQTCHRGPCSPLSWAECVLRQLTGEALLASHFSKCSYPSNADIFN